MEKHIPRLSHHVLRFLVILIISGPNRNNNLHILNITLTAKHLHRTNFIQFDSIHQSGVDFRSVYTLDYIFERSDWCCCHWFNFCRKSAYYCCLCLGTYIGYEMYQEESLTDWELENYDEYQVKYIINIHTYYTISIYYVHIYILVC